MGMRRLRLIIVIGIIAVAVLLGGIVLNTWRENSKVDSFAHPVGMPTLQDATEPATQPATTMPTTMP